jgi:hypothetical protein
MGVTNTCAMMGFGAEGNTIARVLRARERVDEADPDTAAKDADTSSPAHERAIDLNYATNFIVLKRTEDPTILTYVHVTLAFFFHLEDASV